MRTILDLEDESMHVVPPGKFQRLKNVSNIKLRQALQHSKLRKIIVDIDSSKQPRKMLEK